MALVVLLLFNLVYSSAPGPYKQKNMTEARPVMKILFYGDSLTAGYGIDPEKAFPEIIQSKINELGWTFQVVNGGFSGETSSGGLSRIDWVLKNRVDVFILELGGNDGLRGIDPKVTKNNLRGIIQRVKENNPKTKIILAGMQAPPNLGNDFTLAFKEIYLDLAKAESIDLIPFILENVGGIPQLNLPDGIHPTPEGHIIMANNIWKTLRPILEDLKN